MQLVIYSIYVFNKFRTFMYNKTKDKTKENWIQIKLDKKLIKCVFKFLVHNMKIKARSCQHYVGGEIEVEIY